MRTQSQNKNKMSVFYQIRERTGMTQAELSRVLGTDVTTISRWENGKNKPVLDLKQIKVLGILLKGMGLDLNDLPDDAFSEIPKLYGSK